MKHPLDLTGEQRLITAALTGQGLRLTTGDLAGLPMQEKLARLAEISADPVLLGQCLGNALASVELDDFGWLAPLVDLYRQAGADEVAGAQVLAWQRARFDRHGHL